MNRKFTNGETRAKSNAPIAPATRAYPIYAAACRSVSVLTPKTANNRQPLEGASSSYHCNYLVHLLDSLNVCNFIRLLLRGRCLILRLVHLFVGAKDRGQLGGQEGGESCQVQSM